jgi:hypothetical protein
MANVPKPAYRSDFATDFLSQATAVLSRETGRLPGALSDRTSPIPTAPTLPGVSAPHCPIVGAEAPVTPYAPGDLRQRAHELLAGIFSVYGQGKAPSAGQPPYGDKACPVTHAAPPPLGFDKDSLRRHAHEFIDTMLVGFRTATSEDGVVADHRAPLVSSSAPVRAGSAAQARITVVNEEPTASQVTLFCSSFVSDNGHEIPALRVSFSPRVATVPARGQQSFDVLVAVPSQAAPGTYSGLVQAMGSKYVKAVLSIEVL